MQGNRGGGGGGLTHIVGWRCGLLSVHHRADRWRQKATSWPSVHVLYVKCGGKTHKENQQAKKKAPGPGIKPTTFYWHELTTVPPCHQNNTRSLKLRVVYTYSNLITWMHSLAQQRFGKLPNWNYWVATKTFLMNLSMDFKESCCNQILVIRSESRCFKCLWMYGVWSPLSLSGCSPVCSFKGHSSCWVIWWICYRDRGSTQGRPGHIHREDVIKCNKVSPDAVSWHCCWVTSHNKQ